MRTPDRRVVLGVALVAFLQTNLHRLGFAPLIPTFVSDMGLTYAAAGTIQTAYFWTYGIAQVPVGVIADRWGTRRVMLLCMALLALGAVAFAASGTFAASVAARMLVGLGAAAVWVPGMRLVSEWFPPDERAGAVGLISAGGGIGGTLGLMVIPWAAALWGWRIAYGLTAVPAVLTLLLIALVVRPPTATGPPGGYPSGSLSSVLALRAAWPFHLSVFFCYGAYFSFLTFLPAFLVTTLGVSRPEAGFLTGLVTAGTAVSWPLAGWLSDRQGRRKPLFLFSQSTSAVLFAAFAVLPGWAGFGGAAAFAVVTGILIGGIILPFVMIGELFPRELAATAAGVTNTSCFVGAMILPIALGRIVDVTGRFTEAFLVLAALQVLALGAGLLFRETGHAASGPPPSARPAARRA